MNRKVVALVLAGVCALVAGVAVVLYVSRADARAVVGQEPVKIWLTTNAVPRGTTIAEAVKKGWLREDAVPARAVAAEAVKTLPANDFKASSDIAAGEVLLQGRFTEENLGPELLSVPSGHLAVSAELTDAGRVASFVRPGDEVTVFFAPKGGGMSYVLLPRVQVLGTGMSSESGAVETDDKSKDEKVSTQVMTLSVTPAQSAKLVAAAADPDTGTLYFGLLPTTTDVPEDTLGSILPKQLDGLEGRLMAGIEGRISAELAK